MNTSALRKIGSFFSYPQTTAAPAAPAPVNCTDPLINAIGHYSQKHKQAEQAWEILLANVVDLMSEAFQENKTRLSCANTVHESMSINSRSPEHHVNGAAILKKQENVLNL